MRQISITLPTVGNTCQRTKFAYIIRKHQDGTVTALANCVCVPLDCGSREDGPREDEPREGEPREDGPRENGSCEDGCHEDGHLQTVNEDGPREIMKTGLVR